MSNRFPGASKLFPWSGLVVLLFVSYLAVGRSQEKKDGSPSATARRPAVAVPDDGKLRIIVFGAHPDDCEILAGGTATKWAALGHHVKFVSVTNGDIGHWRDAGGPLARRRTAEVQECAKILGIESEVLDIHDGELIPTLENRRTITRLIREWKADLVLGHRPNDYHPDHRNVGVLVQDAAYMVTVPFFCPDTPHLQKNPIFLYGEDRFTKPNRFSGDIVVSIDDVITKKFACVHALESQFYEGGCNGGPQLVPDPNNKSAVENRKQQVQQEFDTWFSGTAQRFSAQLAERYGANAAKKFRYAEAFEICEYGRIPTKDEIRQLFPFFPTL